MRRKSIQLLRLAVGMAILFFLLRQVPLYDLGDVLSGSARQPEWLAAGIAATFLGLVMGVVRWKIILDAQGTALPFRSAFRIFFIGQFFNAFMPGACGGDVARAYYAAKESATRRTEAASTVFVDRAVGLFATILFCCVLIALRLPFFLGHSQAEVPGLLMLVFLLSATAGILALFRRNLFEHFALFRRLEYGTAVGPLIRRAYNAFYLYRHRRRVLGLSVLLSILNLSFLTVACLFFGLALGLPIEKPFVDHFTLFPIVTTLAAIPLTPGALGLREGLFVGMYGAIGIEPAQAISLSLLVYVGGLVCSLLGCLFFISYTSAEHQSLRHELNELKRET